MPSPAKLFIHGQPYFITFRTEEGLPFIPIPVVNEILWSCIAKAQELYPQEIHGLCAQANHQHLLLGCKDPETMPAFVGYIKQESAHAINRLLGRRRKTIWAEGYDSPIILDYEKFLFCLAYVKLNPLKDMLVPSMELFKGVCSLALFKRDQNTRTARLISRDSISKLSNPEMAWKENDSVLKTLFDRNKQEGDVTFNYYSWKKCFPETRLKSDREIRDLMLDVLNRFEENLKTNLPKGVRYLDLSKQSMLKTYQPKKFGKKMICLSSFKELRVNFINFFRRKVAEAQEVFAEWKRGNLGALFPPGMFAPHLPRIANMVPW